MDLVWVQEGFTVSVFFIMGEGGLVLGISVG